MRFAGPPGHGFGVLNLMKIVLLLQGKVAMFRDMLGRGQGCSWLPAVGMKDAANTLACTRQPHRGPPAAKRQLCAARNSSRCSELLPFFRTDVCRQVDKLVIEQGTVPCVYSLLGSDLPSHPFEHSQPAATSQNVVPPARTQVPGFQLKPRASLPKAAILKLVFFPPSGHGMLRLHSCCEHSIPTGTHTACGTPDIPLR